MHISKTKQEKALFMCVYKVCIVRFLYIVRASTSDPLRLKENTRKKKEWTQMPFFLRCSFILSFVNWWLKYDDELFMCCIFVACIMCVVNLLMCLLHTLDYVFLFSWWTRYMLSLVRAHFEAWHVNVVYLYLFIFRECFGMKAETSLGKEKETARR